jgi:hypothetical protein
VGAEPPEDGRSKGGGERTILFIAACSKDFVQGASREAAARQYPVDRRDADRQGSMRRRHWPLDPPDALTKLRKKDVLCGGHARSICSPILFYFCSNPHFCQW